MCRCYPCLVLSAEKFESVLYIKYHIAVEIYTGLPSCCLLFYRGPLRFPHWVDLRFGNVIKDKLSQTGSIQIRVLSPPSLISSAYHYIFYPQSGRFMSCLRCLVLLPSYLSVPYPLRTHP